MPHSSHFPALGACERCLNQGKVFRNVAVFAHITDCEDKNKKAIETFPELRENTPELSLVSMIPDAVHLGKSFKCSWANWFIIHENCRTNLVLIRTLRDFGDDDVRLSLRKHLNLECVRNKDRMAVEPIIKLSKPEVLRVLDTVECVVYTIVPERYTYWKTNLPGICKHPTSVCMGQTGHLLVLDAVSNTETAILQVRLHYPADVTVVKKLGGTAGANMCIAKDVIFLPLGNPSIIAFVDFQKKVKLSPSRIK